VVGSVLSTDPNNAATWITGYLQAGGAQYADGGTYHGYIGRKGVMPFPMPEQDSTSGCTAQNLCYGSIVTYANKIRQAFDANGLLGKPMFQTEGGWGDANVTDSDTQIAWIARFYLLQAGLSVTDSLQLASWYAWGQTASNTWGVIETIDGSKQATAAGNAYAQVYNWLEGATISQPCASLPNSTWTCTLTRPGNYAALAAWSVSGDVQFTPASSYTSCRDLDSGVSCGGWLPRQPITLGIKPVLFEGTQPAATLRRHPRRLPRP